MNQRSSYNRSRDATKGDRKNRNFDEDHHNSHHHSSHRRGGEDEQQQPLQRRIASSSSNYGSSSRSFKDNNPDNKVRGGATGDGRSNNNNNMVFRRNETHSRGGGKYPSRYSKSTSTPETSPGRGLSHPDNMNSYRSDNSSQRSSFGSYYRSGPMSSYRDREYAPKRPDHIVSSRIYDNSRYVSFLMRLQRDEDRERQASMVRQLKDIFAQPENLKVIITNLDETISTIDDLLQGGYYLEYKQDIISSLAMLGFAVANESKRLFEYDCEFTDFEIVLKWMFNLYNLSKSGDIHLLVLSSLYEMMKNDKEKRGLADLMPYVMSNIQSVLEIADVPELLVGIVDIILEISNGYPDVFSQHFSDTVDILIGWHIDTTQQQSVIEYISKALINFQQFWLYDITFTVTLLGQFLEDMESYAEEIVKFCSLNSYSDENLQSSPSENISKIRSLVRVLITVLRSVENSISPDGSFPLTRSFMLDMLKNFLNCIIMTSEYTYYYDLMTLANNCVCLFFAQLGTCSSELLDILVQYIDVQQCQDAAFSCEKHTLSLLQMMIHFVKIMDTRLPVEFVSGLFKKESLTRQLRFSVSPKVQQHMMLLYHAVLDVKNVQAVEEFYSCIVADMTEAFSVLLNYDVNTKNESFSSFQNAQVVLLSGLTALVEIGNAKHSIIRMWALKPSYFELLTDKLRPVSSSIAKNCPAVQYAILFTLYSHCQRHKHFVGNSPLINQNQSRSSRSSSGHNSPILTSVLAPTQNSKNLEGILVLLADLLNCSETSHDSRMLAIQWTLELMESFEYHLIHLVDRESFKQLLNVVIKTVYSEESAVISKICCLALQKIIRVVGPSLPEHVLESCFELCILRLNSFDTTIQDLYASLLVLLPITTITSVYPVSAMKLSTLETTPKNGMSFNKSHVRVCDLWSACHLYMTKPHHGVPASQQFKTITSFILQGLEPQNEDWLLHLFFSSPPSVDLTKPDKIAESVLSPYIERSKSVLWFWATWEVAQMCVMCKLRTPLGKPQETFMAIEGALKSCLKSLKHESSGDKENKLLRINLLLALMEHLEKLMYNAYEGCAYALPAAPKIVRTFFRTNKATCLEWLSRVRMTVCLVALNAGQPAVALRNGYELLLEMKAAGKTEVSEYETVLFCITKALIELHSPEALLGLYVWCKDKLNQKLTWIKATIDHASGKFETAAREYCCVLHSLKNGHSPSKSKILKDLVKNNDTKLRNGTSWSLGLDSEDIVKVLDQLSVKDISQFDTDHHLQSFLVDQITDCYVNLGCWSDVSKWMSAQEKLSFSQNGVSLPSVSDNLSYLKALSVFEEEFIGIESGKLNSDINSINTKQMNMNSFQISNWDVYDKVHSIEKYLLSAVVQYEKEKDLSIEEEEELKYNLVEAKSRALELIKVSVLDWPPLIHPLHGSFFSTICAIESVITKADKVPHSLIHEDIKLDPANYSCSTLTSTLAWKYVHSHISPKDSINDQSNNDYLVDLLLVSARLARKHQNLKLAHKLLWNCSSHLIGEDKSLKMDLASHTGITDVAKITKMLKKSLDIRPSKKIVKMMREGCKLLHGAGETETACDFLLQSCLSVAVKINEDAELDFKFDKTKTLKDMNSRSLLNVVKYLQQDSRNLLEIFQDGSQDSSILGNNWTLALTAVLEIEKLSRNMSIPINGFLKGMCLERENVIGETDFLIGRLLLLSVCQCPSLAKSWCVFASWCYRWGRKVIDNASNTSMTLLPDEEMKLQSLVPNVSKDEFDIILSIITSLHCSSGEWGGQDSDYSENGAEKTHRLLLSSCPFLLLVPNFEKVVEGLVEIWQKASSRMYYYYKIAAQSYLQYLQLNGMHHTRDRTEDDNVTATLRLLRLVVKHASELREVLEEGLANTPTAPWRGIIPQLFSRLNHPEPYVRQSISDLLCRVAQDSPHLIVFPAVVGSLTLKAGPHLPEEASNLFGAYFSEQLEDGATAELERTNSQSPDHSVLQNTIPGSLSDEEDTEEDHQKNAIMQNCFAALVETLGRQDGRTISEVKNLVHELYRITLLWDELWLGTLNLHHSEVSRRISNLEKEISKVMSNSNLGKEEKKEVIQEKYNVYMKPTIFILEQLQHITGHIAETPNEQWFQKTFDKQIEYTINKIKNPADPRQPQESWLVFRKLHQLFQQKLRQTRTPIQMSDISPVLSSLSSTVIPMPGIKKKGSDIVTIQSVCGVVSVLPTKTKPKKLAFIGSDGCKYGYLFKGLEDLHLDERIMQFLSIVNNMFAKNKRHGKEIYNARHYSVTPLGPRSGLIQWVDGATALFSLYKKWQQREAVALSLKGQSAISGVSNTPAVMRPSEIYYNKLTPLLKENGIVNLENRKEWPINVLLNVLKELMDETPSDLLEKELWCHCTSALEWWNVTQTYNHSTAVMSVIGYIIGLGDRHLDNVLVDLTTGEVVHIDYNVCFEKGKNLRVPEKVPFRMTPNIETALGVTGIEGIFRVSCEHALKVLRKGRETLLTLLEAFVYDPLVDWTPGNEGGYTGAMYGGRQVWANDIKQTRQEMEHEIAWSMLCIRVTEMKGDWTKNRNDLLDALPKLENLLEDLENGQLMLQAAESRLQECCIEKALLEEAQSSATHHLYTLPQRYEEIKMVKGALKIAQDAVQEKLAECKKWHNLHTEALSGVCGAELSKWIVEASNTPISDTLSVAPVIEFLQSAGQGQLVQQCEHLETELKSILQQQRMATRNCVDVLRSYATIIKQFGPSFSEHGRFYKWKEWLESLLSNFTVLRCQEIVTEFQMQFSIESSSVATIQSAVALNFKLQEAINDLNGKLHNLYERQVIEGFQDKSTFEAYLEELKLAIVHYLTGEGSQQRHMSLLCIFVTVFCGIYKRLIMMEKSASAAGDSLVDLTSWGGDWFLDEMCAICANITEFVKLLLNSWPASDHEAKVKFNGVCLSYCVFNSLEDLSLNFQNIILHEAINSSNEPTVKDMIAKLDRIIARCGVPLDRLIAELETNTRNIILETQVAEDWVNDIVKKLKNEFESLMKKTEPQISDLNQGQMLLMGFNGLFTKVDAELDVLLSFLDSQSIPQSWKKLDVFRDTVAFAPFVHNHDTRSIMKDIYFLRKLMVMQQFFHLCQDYVSMLQFSSRPDKSCNDIYLVSEYHLVKPVKVFTAEYVRRMVLGLPSQALGYTICLLLSHLGFNLNAEIDLRDVGVENKISIEDIGKKAVDICVAENYLQSQLSAVSEHTGNYEGAWRKFDTFRRLEQNIAVCKNSIEHMQLQLARFQWLNEDLLVLGNIGPLQNFTIPSRASVMSDMRKIVPVLVGYETTIGICHERYLNLTSSIEQRLKWATGANPSLATVQEEFEAAISSRTAAVSNANQFARDLANVCNAILHFEALRTRTTEALSSDNAFLTLIASCKESCSLAENCNSQVCVAEEHLLALEPLTDNVITPAWIGNAMEKVSTSLSNAREELEQRKAFSHSCWESLHSHVKHVHDLLSAHHKLMTEVRQILRNLTKHEEQEYRPDAKHRAPVHSYIALFKQFSEQILTVVNELLSNSREIGVGRLKEIKMQIPHICVSVSEVYNQLLTLAGSISTRAHGSQAENQKRRKSDSNLKYGLVLNPPDGSGSTNVSPMHHSGVFPRTPKRSRIKKKSVTRDPRTGKAIQERNTYATNVWKRVKMKLDGRDPDPNRKATIPEQVDFIVREATNMENLAVLYEGWTPWV